MKRASYRDAIDFIAFNDEDGSDDHLDEEAVKAMASVLLVASIFDVERERVARDVVRLRVKEAKAEAKRDRISFEMEQADQDRNEEA